MTVRRIAQVAAIAVATLMIAGSASAQANGPIWNWNGVPVGGVTEKIINIPISGSIYVNEKSGFQLHPCAWSGTRNIWNSAFGVGVGEVETATFNAPCNTSFPGCTAETVTPNNLPWSTKLFYVGAAIWDEISNFTFTIRFDKGAACKKFGVAGNPVTYTGRITAQWTGGTKCETGTEEELENQLGEPVEAGFEACSTESEELEAE